MKTTRVCSFYLFRQKKIYQSVKIFLFWSTFSDFFFKTIVVLKSSNSGRTVRALIHFSIVPVLFRRPVIIKNIWAFILKARPDSTCSCGITVQLHCMLNGDRDMCFMNTLLVKYTTRQRYPGKSRAETHIVRRSLVLRLIAIALSLSLSLFLSLSHTHTHTQTPTLVATVIPTIWRQTAGETSFKIRCS